VVSTASSESFEKGIYNPVCWKNLYYSLPQNYLVQYIDHRLRKKI